MAGGTGTRMKSDVPKQFLLVDGIPIIVHSIRKFLEYDKEISIIAVLPEAHIRKWDDIQSEFFHGQVFITANGGATRTASVLAGLAHTDMGLVAIHDAVRPFVSTETISASFEAAKKFGSGVATVELKDSIRELNNKGSIARDRANYVLVQTPQTFNVMALKAAYDTVGSGQFTDDASVFEAAGNSVTLVDGSYDNIKITTPEDLK